MKRIILALMLISTLILSACGAPQQAPDNSKTDESKQMESSQPQTTPDTNQKEESPTFEDGDFYLEAVTKHDVSLCAKIGNADLKKQCEEEAPVKN